MAVYTRNQKSALICFHQPWQVPVPSPVNGLTVGDRWYLIWEYPWIEVIRRGISNLGFSFRDGWR